MTTLREIHDRLANLVESGELARKHEYEVEQIKNQLFNIIVANEGKTPNYAEMEKPIVTVDFDGVIHSYKSGWQGPAVIPDEPLPGAIRWLERMTKWFSVVIFSARCNHPDAVKNMINWMYEHGISHTAMTQITFSPGKPSWFVHIDDRNVQFTGTFPEPQELLHFKPWYYAHPEWNREVAQTAGV